MAIKPGPKPIAKATLIKSSLLVIPAKAGTQRLCFSTT